MPRSFGGRSTTTWSGRRQTRKRRFRPRSGRGRVLPRPVGTNGIAANGLADLAACGKSHAAFERRCIPPEPRLYEALCVAFRSKYTRYSSLTRLVSRAPRRSRCSRHFLHRLLDVSDDNPARRPVTATCGRSRRRRVVTRLSGLRSRLPPPGAASLSGESAGPASRGPRRRPPGLRDPRVASRRG